ncbi:jg1796 [Pararge aegeria aegeria]|uniref:Jg1796 protein n=1 Tax=Pararge aegeria aegeria TaxID=348720 RepID=A0A8S4RRW8_9NEOP|nr:jg1796 [Pararge aegeria aegeria]
MGYQPHKDATALGVSLFCGKTGKREQDCEVPEHTHRSISETLGQWGPEARALFKELSKRVIESTGDPRAGRYLGQRISLAIQRGNAASILGTVRRCGDYEDVLDFI